jgi:hypothetical protein
MSMHTYLLGLTDYQVRRVRDRYWLDIRGLDDWVWNGDGKLLLLRWQLFVTYRYCDHTELLFWWDWLRLKYNWLGVGLVIDNGCVGRRNLFGGAIVPCVSRRLEQFDGADGYRKLKVGGVCLTRNLALRPEQSEHYRRNVGKCEIIFMDYARYLHTILFKSD